jgi:ATP-dependent DNA helicase RecQ
MSAIRRLGRSESGAAVIYAGTRRVVETIRSDLARLGISTAAYHAGLEPEVRSRVQEEFLTGKTRKVVATNAFGMGVDKSDVRLVLHYQLPATLESYYQEAGRAGRDGGAARCVALWGEDDQRLHKAFLDRSRPPIRLLKRAVRAIRRTVGAGERGLVEADHLLRVTGCKEEDLGTLLAALERLDVVRVYSGPGQASVEPGLIGPILDLGVRALGPDWSRARRLRDAGAEGLRAIREYATAPRCRRRALLGYFGDETPTCGGCDVCGDGH